MRLLLSVFVAAPLLSPALAQDRVPQGIGFAQAEEGTWLCRHEDPAEALACARELCAEQPPGQDCVPTAWCFPARWSGVMTVWLPDFQTTKVLCGMNDEAALKDVLAALCKSSTDATHCDLTLSVDPDGNERKVEGVSFAGGAAPAVPEAPAPDDAEDPGETETGGEAPGETE